MKTVKEQIAYFHVCYFCDKHWWSTNKVDDCPKCGRLHIWFRGTSKLADEEMEIQNDSAKSTR